MFIGLLDETQQTALCRIVQFLSTVDGDADHREGALEAALLEESHLETLPPPAESLDEVESLLAAFDSDLAKRALVLESLGVALADNVTHPDEVRVIEAMAKGLDVPLEWLELARDYVQRALELQHYGRDLVLMEWSSAG